MMMLARSAVIQVAGGEQRQDLLPDLVDELAVCRRIRGVTKVAVIEKVNSLPMDCDRLYVLLCSRLQDIHFDVDAREGVRADGVGASVAAHLQIAPCAELGQQVEHSCPQPVARIPGSESAVDEVGFL